MDWIEIDKTKRSTLPYRDCWVYNYITEIVEFLPCGSYVSTGIYTHYQVAEKPEPPKDITDENE